MVDYKAENHFDDKTSAPTTLPVEVENIDQKPECDISGVEEKFVTITQSPVKVQVAEMGMNDDLNENTDTLTYLGLKESVPKTESTPVEENVLMGVDEQPNTQVSPSMAEKETSEKDGVENLELVEPTIEIKMLLEEAGQDAVNERKVDQMPVDCRVENMVADTDVKMIIEPTSKQPNGTTPSKANHQDAELKTGIVPILQTRFKLKSGI
jgi:hypothetical protein